jgi:hypothetical protein
MPCYKPIKCWHKVGGGVTFTKDETATVEMSVPCNGCIGCRVARSKEWAIRCMHEAQLHDRNCFITLTYDDKHIPYDHGLVKADFQKFMKRLRKKYTGQTIRYYMAGEYGSNPEGGLGRPHYHAILFGIDFNDKYIWDKKRKMYRSENLEKLWNKGYSSLSDVTLKSCAYVARYVMKKINGDLAEEHYKKVDPLTGEIYQIIPEYNAMSLKPGIAYDWYQSFKDDVFPHDYVVHNGHKCKTPAYYMKLLEKELPHVFEDVKQKRKEYAQKNPMSEREREARMNSLEYNMKRMERPLQ